MMVDTLTDMRGSVKPYRRQVRFAFPSYRQHGLIKIKHYRELPASLFSSHNVLHTSTQQVLISTGKADWAKEVTDVDGTLAKYLSDADSRLGSGRKKEKERSKDSKDKLASPPSSPKDSSNGNARAMPAPAPGPLPAGVFAATSHQRLSVLNGSHHALTTDADTHATALVLPDYVAIASVPVSSVGAEALWRHACDPAVERAGTHAVPTEGSDKSEEAELKTWPLPYNCVILLCK